MTTNPEYPEEFLSRLRAVTGRRARIVVEHIIEHGFITTEDLETRYGYKHPPRAVRDVREQGIPIETFTARNSEGRAIAAYRFGDPEDVRPGRTGGRRAFPKRFKQELLEEHGHKCAICQAEFEGRYLQIDHRIPYEVAGNADDEQHTQDYMLLCGPCNRAKAWSCEHCANTIEIGNPDLCKTCYWASPLNYRHIALRPLRRLDIVWSAEEVEIYDRLEELVQAMRESMPEYVKSIIEQHVRGDRD